MERSIKPNDNNNLKFMPEKESVARGAKGIMFVSGDDPMIKDLPITGEAAEHGEKLEYFTE